MASPVVDTSLSVGISPLSQFVVEAQFESWLEDNRIDIQFVYQPDESFAHETPEWNSCLGNDYVAKAQELFPGRAYGLATVQVWHQPFRGGAGSSSPQSHELGAKATQRNPAFEELERCIVDLGLTGLRMNPVQHNYSLANRSLVWPVLRRLVELQEQVGRPLVVSVHAYGDSLNNAPETLALTAREFPELLFLMQHSAFVWGYGTVSTVAAPVENIMLDLTTMPQRSIVWEAYERHGPEKFCIGTDGPLGSPLVKTAIVEDFARSPNERGLILGGNLARRLGLEIPERRV